MASLRRDKDRVARESVDFLWAGDGGSNQSRKPGPDVPDMPDVPDVPCLSRLRQRSQRKLPRMKFLLLLSIIRFHNPFLISLHARAVSPSMNLDSAQLWKFRELLPFDDS